MTELNQFAIDTLSMLAKNSQATGISINDEIGTVSLNKEIIAFRTTNQETGDLTYYGKDESGQLTKPLYSTEVRDGQGKTIIYDEYGKEFGSVSMNAAGEVSQVYSPEYAELKEKSQQEQLDFMNKHLPSTEIINKITESVKKGQPKTETCTTPTPTPEPAPAPQYSQTGSASKTDAIIYQSEHGSKLSVAHTGIIDERGAINNPKDTISFTDSKGQSCTLDPEFLKTQANFAKAAIGEGAETIGISKSILHDGSTINSTSFAVKLPDLPKSCDDFKPIKTAKVEPRGR